MASRSTLGARASIPARLLSITYDRPVIIRLQAFLGKNLGAHVEAGCHSMVADFDLISSQDAKILHA